MYQHERTNRHLQDIINTTHAEVSYPSEQEVAHELLLKRIYSVHKLPWNLPPLNDRI